MISNMQALIIVALNLIYFINVRAFSTKILLIVVVDFKNCNSLTSLKINYSNRK